MRVLSSALGFVFSVAATAGAQAAAAGEHAATANRGDGGVVWSSRGSDCDS